MALAAVSGCATTRPGREAAAGLPWEVPFSAFPTQRLYRVSYDGPEGGGSFKLTLRLAAPARYQVMAADPLGRPLWSLDAGVDGAGEPAASSSGWEMDVAGGLWLDHRNRLLCHLRGRLEIAHLTPFPVAALPALLLGRLPAAPASGEVAPGVAAALAAGEPPLPGSLSYADADGRRWTATLAGGRPRAWSMREPGEGMAAVTWSGAGGEAVLSDRGRGVQVRWREVVAEPLGTLHPLPAPADYVEVDCAAAYRPSE